MGKNKNCKAINNSSKNTLEETVQSNVREFNLKPVNQLTNRPL